MLSVNRNIVWGVGRMSSHVNQYTGKNAADVTRQINQNLMHFPENKVLNIQFVEGMWYGFVQDVPK